MSILKKAKRVFRLPDVAAAEPLRRSSIFILTWVISVIGLFTFLVFYSFFADSYKVAPMIGLALALVLSFIAYRRGELGIAVNILVWSFLAGLFGLAVYNDGLRDTALDTMPALLVVSALLLGKRPFMVMSLLYFLSLFALGLLQINRILVYPSAYAIDPTDLFDILGIDGATIVLVTMLSTLLRKSLARVKDGEELLSESELRYRDLFNNAGMAIFQSGMKGEVLEVNPEFARMFGFDSPEEVQAEIGNASNFFVDPNRRSEIIRIKKEHPDLSVFENLYRRKDGSSFLGRLNVRMIRDQAGGLRFIQGFIEDITESRRVESALLESQALTYAIVNSTPDWIWSVDIENFGLMMFNEGMRDYFLERRGITVRVGQRLEELFPSEDYILRWRGHYERALREGPYTAEYPVFAGTNILQLTFNLLKSDGRTYGISVFGRDVTERRQAEEDIRLSLAEKETLLRELYHRTKNNMNTIIAMLNLQARADGDPRLTEAFTVAQNRILSMSLVHERLYKSKDLSRVDLKEYITDLISLLADTYSVPHDRLSLVSELEPVSVMIDSAIPCGLVLNELISNSMKHAFPGDRTGMIRVGLTSRADGLISLEVTDTGIGVPPGFDFRRDGRFGSQTIFSLIENQLGGRVSLDTRAGVAWRFEFRDDQYSPSV